MLQDKFLWKFLTIIGVRISGYKLKPCEKYISSFVITLGSVSMVHWISSTLFYTSTNGVIIREFVYLLMPFQIILIWYFLNAQRGEFCDIRKELYSYRNRYIKNNNRTYYVELFLMVMILVPGVISLIVAVSDEKVSRIWSYGYKMQDEILAYMLSSYVTFMYYSWNIIIILVAFSLSIIFYRWGEVLNKYNELLDVYFKQGKINGRIDFLKEFFYIVKIIQNLDQAVAYPSFIIIWYSLELIFIMLYRVLVFKYGLFKIEFIIEVTFSGVCGFFVVVIYSLSSSTIPEKLAEIRKTAKYCIIQCGDDKNSHIHRNVTFYLKRIEKEDIVYITGCRMFSITRQFILSAIGMTLTYDLLIINLK